MSIGLIVFLAICAFVLLYGVMIYNGLVSLKHAVSKHLSNIDVLLKQRHEELPKLVATCKQYMQYEQDTLEKVIKARQQVADAQASHDMRALGAAETGLRANLGSLFALAENYPELKANDSFQQLQSRISQLENAIADRREVYNEAVNNNNVRIEQFPDVLVARWFNFKDFDLLEFSEEETRDVNIGSLFK
ncbi:LemA family protein [Spongiibacter sp. KMU-158]|uniref:LemA family protein n=1 Tax=Spongiibacter pelagi TaxID=2760804 RepID=A0A927C1F3_9GAMM|nr:LemA family protein [Spongiibacter pelagi]MBD2858117.1 LemA family protein [Spongiibacter pelagi]